MGYGELVDRFTDDIELRVTAFPDGSVDTYDSVFDEHGERITDRKTFGERIAGDDLTSIPIDRDSREPGGQATNMAVQAHALGGETTVVGHLDDPVFDGLPFETLSMGEPARIDVYPFDDDDLVISRTSSDLDSWSLADLRAARSPSWDPLSADVVCCGNWASLEGVTAALAELAELAGETGETGEASEGGTFVLDPGPVKNRSRAAVSELLTTLGELESAFDVVYSVIPAEFEYTVEAAGIEAETDRERLAGVREVTGISGVVLHASERAIVATAEDNTDTETETELEREMESERQSGSEYEREREHEREREREHDPVNVITVPNIEVERTRRRTGAGDRFSAGVAIARAREWNLEAALALGNLCAAYYVETAETGDRFALLSYLDRRSTN
ncbi:PfkB family carbohydrate kinase [Natronoglomus mannanivorans]|uniref:PfkB family carbohydrate kinase n=1 Tax=Natronoglomus mannanivorans TaxID=2979990 RepID=A0AAP2YYA3_9EURY|nr:PfkB family carbohydrate kinase [Halobacteria archaeon AArc-xg1-1]